MGDRRGDMSRDQVEEATVVGVHDPPWAEAGNEKAGRSGLAWGGDGQDQGGFGRLRPRAVRKGAKAGCQVGHHFGGGGVERPT